MRNERSALKDRRVARNVVPGGEVQARRVAFHGGFGAVGRSDSTFPPFSDLLPPPAEKSRAVSLKLFPGTRLESALKEGRIRVSASSLLLHAEREIQPSRRFPVMPHLRVTSVAQDDSKFSYLLAQTRSIAILVHIPVDSSESNLETVDSPRPRERRK